MIITKPMREMKHDRDTTVVSDIDRQTGAVKAQKQKKLYSLCIISKYLLQVYIRHDFFFYFPERYI